MKIMKSSLFISTLFLFMLCDLPHNMENLNGFNTFVNVKVIGNALSGSYYMVTVTGDGMETIGPERHEAGSTIRLNVTPGNARRFRFLRYAPDDALSDTCNIVTDITGGKNIVTVNLTHITTEKMSFRVSYDGNLFTNGSVPETQIKDQGVDLTLRSNSGLLERKGYTFVGWNTSADGKGTDYAEGAVYKLDSTITLYAKWTDLLTYVVRYDGNQNSSGTVPATQTKVEGEELALATNGGLLMRTGFKFVCWNTSADGKGKDYPEGGKYTTDSAVTLYAKWTDLLTYVVRYDGNKNSSGTVPATQTKVEGEELPLATNSGLLQRTGFKFVCWNTSADGKGKDYPEGGKYTADSAVTLYAKWTDLLTYVVHYDGNQSTSGTVPVAQSKTEGIPLDLATNSGLLQRTGLRFVCWNTSADGKGKDYAEGGKYTTDSAVTLYAKWTDLLTYVVRYDGNQSTAGKVPATQTKVEGEELTLATNSGLLQRTGFKFVCWNTSADGKGKDYVEGGKYTADSAVVLYAKWTDLLTYVVRYDGNQSTSGTVPATQSKTEGIPLDLATNSGLLQRTGFRFVCWNTATDGKGKDYAEGGSYAVDSAVTLYAKWSELSVYKIRYDGNQNTAGTAPAQQTEEKGTPLKIETNSGSLERTGYMFDGWSTSADGVGTEYKAGDSYTNNVDLVLYAKWIEVFKIRYDGNQNSAGTAPAPQTKIKDKPITLETNTGSLERTGYSFAGWSTSADGVGTEYLPGATYKINSDVLLYAKWDPINTVGYDGNLNPAGTFSTEKVSNR